MESLRSFLSFDGPPGFLKALVIMLCVLAAALGVAVVEHQRVAYKSVILNDGSRVSCKDVWPGNCGVTLRRCSDGVDRLCLREVKLVQ